MGDGPCALHCQMERRWKEPALCECMLHRFLCSGHAVSGEVVALRAYCARRRRDTHPRLPITCLIARRSSKAHRITTKLPSNWCSNVSMNKPLSPVRYTYARACKMHTCSSDKCHTRMNHQDSGHTIGNKHQSIWLHHPCLLGVPIVGRVQYGYITPAFSGSPKWGEINMATSPLPSRGPHSGESSIWLTPAFSGSP